MNSIHPHFGARAGSVGHAIRGVDVEIARPESAEQIEWVPDGELGEIVIRGRNVLSGYPGRPKETSAAFIDGWFHTCGLGRKDADGFISIVDRTKDVIIRGGFNVYPHEVEEVLLRHPAIAEAAVIGLPHATPGEEIYAVLIADKHGDAFRRRTRLRTPDARCARPVRGRRHRSPRRLRAHRRQTGYHPAAPESRPGQRPGRANRGGAAGAVPYHGEPAAGPACGGYSVGCAWRSQEAGSPDARARLGRTDRARVPASAGARGGGQDGGVGGAQVMLCCLSGI